MILLKLEPKVPEVPLPSVPPVLTEATTKVSLSASVSWCVPLDV